jgi:hypothetical protein
VKSTTKQTARPHCHAMNATIRETTKQSGTTQSRIHLPTRQAPTARWLGGGRRSEPCQLSQGGVVGTYRENNMFMDEGRGERSGGRCNRTIGCPCRSGRRAMGDGAGQSCACSLSLSRSLHCVCSVGLQELPLCLSQTLIAGHDGSGPIPG